jgi:hypothetical protein
MICKSELGCAAAGSASGETVAVELEVSFAGSGWGVIAETVAVFVIAPVALAATLAVSRICAWPPAGMARAATRCPSRRPGSVRRHQSLPGRERITGRHAARIRRGVVRRQFNPDPPQPVKQINFTHGLGSDPFEDRADRSPRDAHHLRDGGLRRVSASHAT